MDRFRVLFDTVHDGLLVFDGEGCIQDVNRTGCSMLGYSREELSQMSAADIVPAELSGLMRAHIDASGSNDSKPLETLLLNRGGSQIPVEIRTSRIDLDGRPCLFSMVRDIGARKAAEREVQLSHAAINMNSTPFYWISQEGEFISVNAAACASLGYSQEELIGKHIWDIDPYYPPEAQSETWEKIKALGSFTLESAHRRKDGSEFPILVTINYANFEGEEHSLVFVQDITDRKRSEERITYLAYYDELTGLPNRRKLLEQLQHSLAVSARSQICGAILFIDIDNFKTINDTLGHEAGDMLLREVASRLCRNVREEDIVSRLGGDEFVVVLEKVDADRQRSAAHAKLVGEKLLDTLVMPFFIHGMECVVSASIGVSIFKGHDQEIEELFKQSDLAMYEAKRKGRNSLLFFDPAMQNALEKRTRMETELRIALEMGQFELYFQRRVDENGKAVGAEALLRWQHPEKGLISPAEFIPLCEETGLILPIGNWVLEEACSVIKAWEGSPRTSQLVLSINISARQLRQENFAETIAAAIRNSGIDPTRLELEITESMLHSDIDLIIEKMEALRAQGVHFSMDDFGTGYSSLSYLKRLPIDQIKIDQSFVRDITQDQNDETIVQLIIKMSQTLGLESVAEGVESIEQLDLLLHHGCRQFQGYFFGRPMSRPAFEKTL